MIYCEALAPKQLKRFYAIPGLVYAGNPNHRSTEEDVMKMLVEQKSAFFTHAQVHPFVITSRGHDVGRFALIHDAKLPDYVQVAFFEAIWGLTGVEAAILEKAKSVFPHIKRVVVGLCGHLNYAAGMLDSTFDEPPVFGLPYSPPYYKGYFPSLQARPLVSYRFENQIFYDLLERGLLDVPLGNITIRTMDRKRLKRDVAIYTELNNACFKDHPYWSDRTPEEDYELFYPFRFLMREQNLLIAEDGDRPIGFLLWYPDFNELVTGSEPLFLQHVARYHLFNPVESARLTEIAVLPEYRRRGIVQAMIKEMSIFMYKANYKYTEGGFIFEENQASIGVTLKMLEKAFGRKIEPHRRYFVLDGTL